MRLPRGIATGLVAFGLAGLGCLVWGLGIEPGRLVVRETRIELPGWPSALDGLRIAVLTDLHVGSPQNGLDRLARVVEETNRARPDLIVLLGDLVIHGVVGGHFVPPEESAAVLARLQAPLGVVSVLGNHDWWLDGPRVRTALESQGVRVLENGSVAVERRAAAAGPTADRAPARLRVAGVADLWTRSVDVAAALADVSPGEPVVLLTHNPDVFPDVPPSVALTLAGHTHGGQVRLPFVGRPIVPSRYGQRYAAGVVVESGRTLFVSTGVGTSIIPVRFRVPPEVSVVTIARASTR